MEELTTSSHFESLKESQILMPNIYLNSFMLFMDLVQVGTARKHTNIQDKIGWSLWKYKAYIFVL